MEIFQIEDLYRMQVTIRLVHCKIMWYCMLLQYYMHQGDNLSTEVYNLMLAFVHTNNMLIISVASNIETK